MKVKSSRLAIILAVFIVAALGFYWINQSDQARSFLSNIKLTTRQNSHNTISSEDVESKVAFDLAIEKLNVTSPVNVGVDPSDEAKYDEALKDGVNHIPGTALPNGKTGNIVIYGHSSSKESGNYGKIFATLNNLETGDIINLYYDGKDYNFAVLEKKIVEADDLTVLDQTKDQHLTLLTCWPIGTADKRLAIVATRIN